MGLTAEKVSLGEVCLAEPLNDGQIGALDDELRKIGFELVTGKNEKLVLRIKQFVLSAVRTGKPLNRPLSIEMGEAFNEDYQVLNRAFVEGEGRTIEKYYILQRLEYVKELIEYGELTMKEIAYRTGFSSVAHLSRQFKQFTGLTPTEYKKIGHYQRKCLDKI